jgi:hypothetical protein
MTPNKPLDKIHCDDCGKKGARKRRYGAGYLCDKCYEDLKTEWDAELGKALDTPSIQLRSYTE